jgi:hypothetical protein
MSGLVELVPLAELLAAVSGSRQAAVALAGAIARGDAQALVHGQTDAYATARAALRKTGVLTEAGVPCTGRAAELVLVCDLLAASTQPPSLAPPDPRLVLSAPEGSVPLLDAERLETLVLDVIRRSTTSLVVGGAFWNDAGFEILDDVLLPALTTRHVATVIYANPPSAEHRDVLVARLRTLEAAGPVSVRWFSGPRPTMLHAKFVIRDRIHGYLGTANLTSWGMEGHIEAGVELTPGQCERFTRFLEQLDAAGLFTDRPPAS